MSDVLLIIDPQNDFCAPNGALSVPGADADMDRLAVWLDQHGAQLDAVLVSLDCHQRLDISHPLWFTNTVGAHPAPFTVITADDLVAGRWTTTRPEDHDRTVAYLQALAENGRYPHVIWPEHCLVGTPGHNVYPALAAALARFEGRPTRVQYHLKGQNPHTEHFSAVRAEVPDPADPSTTGNPALLATLSAASRVFVAGEASSHCVANTVRDLVAAGVPADRLVLLTDTTSAVPGFGDYETRFIAELTALGMKTSTTQASFS